MRSRCSRSSRSRTPEVSLDVLPDTATMRAVIAGLIAGVSGALATAAVVLIAIARDPRWHGAPPVTRLPLPALGVLSVNGMMLAWSLAGLLLGLLYAGAAAGRGDGETGPAVSFALAITAAILVALLAARVVRRRLTWPMAATAAIAIASYGALFPALAG